MLQKGEKKLQRLMLKHNVKLLVEKRDRIFSIKEKLKEKKVKHYNNIIEKKPTRNYRLKVIFIQKMIKLIRL